MTDQEREAIRIRRGYWIRLGRRARGWTLKELGAALGYDGDVTGNLSKWETGDRPVPSDLFTPIARALGLPAEYLVNPPLTDEERLAAAIADASALERADWDRAEAPALRADGERDDEPRTRSA